MKHRKEIYCIKKALVLNFENTNLLKKQKNICIHANVY